MASQEAPTAERVRAAEVVAALCLATDLGMGFPFEHGLRATLVAMRLAERLGVDRRTASQTYYGSLLFHSGCTTDATLATEIFGDTLTTHFVPFMFGSSRQALAGMVRALPDPGAAPPARASDRATPSRAARGGKPHHLRAACEVAEMLSERLGLPPPVSSLFPYVTERWDGKGGLGRAKGEDAPAALRIVHVAADAIVQELVGGVEHAARAARERAGHAFDPAVAECFAADAAELLALADDGSVWDGVLAAEPPPAAELEGEAIDRALAAVGDFADLASPYLAGHSAGVASLADAAADGPGSAPPIAPRFAARPSCTTWVASLCPCVCGTGRVRSPPTTGSR